MPWKMSRTICLKLIQTVIKYSNPVRRDTTRTTYVTCWRLIKRVVNKEEKKPINCVAADCSQLACGFEIQSHFSSLTNCTKYWNGFLLLSAIFALVANREMNAQFPNRIRIVIYLSECTTGLDLTTLGPRVCTVWAEAELRTEHCLSGVRGHYPGGGLDFHELKKQDSTFHFPQPRLIFMWVS